MKLVHFSMYTLCMQQTMYGLFLFGSHYVYIINDNLNIETNNKTTICFNDTSVTANKENCVFKICHLGYYLFDKLTMFE